jgi:hypothetical protein
MRIIIAGYETPDLPEHFGKIQHYNTIRHRVGRPQPLRTLTVPNLFGSWASTYDKAKGTAQAHRFSRHPAEMIICRTLATYKGQASTYDKACRLGLSQNFSDG